jgi:hypothetical protein
VKTFYIPNEVLTALDNIGQPRLVLGLLELCNRALAGQSTGGASLSQVNDAATAINEGFDGCRFIVTCDDPNAVVGTTLKPGAVTGSGLSIKNAPTHFELRQNAPNPFNPATTIRIALPQATEWNVSVYSVTGQLVKRFEGQTGGAQFIDVRWDGTDNNGAPVSSGVYLYRVVAGHYVDTKKMVLLK